MSSYALRVNSVFGAMLRILGIGALIAGGLTVAIAAIAAVLMLSPLVFWVAWNVLDFAHAVGLPELSFWGIVLATCFSFSAGCKVVIAGIIFLVDPSWFANGQAQVRWPEPTFRNFVAVALLALLASRPHAHAHKRSRREAC